MTARRLGLRGRTGHDRQDDLQLHFTGRFGGRSAHTWFVLRELLGHPHARNYDGSWTEWGSMVGMPVALGPSPGALTGHVGLQPAPVGLRAR